MTWSIWTTVSKRQTSSSAGCSFTMNQIQTLNQNDLPFLNQTFSEPLIPPAKISLFLLPHHLGWKLRLQLHNALQAEDPNFRSTIIKKSYKSNCFILDSVLLTEGSSPLSQNALKGYLRMSLISTYIFKHFLSFSPYTYSPVQCLIFPSVEYEYTPFMATKWSPFQWEDCKEGQEWSPKSFCIPFLGFVLFLSSPSLPCHSIFISFLSPLQSSGHAV